MRWEDSRSHSNVLINETQAPWAGHKLDSNANANDTHVHVQAPERQNFLRSRVETEIHSNDDEGEDVHDSVHYLSVVSRKMENTCKL